MSARDIWNHWNDRLASTIFHPQYFAKRGEYWVVAYLKKLRPKIILDVGCGRQPHRGTLDAVVGRYMGLDYPKNLAYYHSPYPVELRADARRIPLPDRSIDAVMMLWVVEHLEDPDAVFAEIHRVLRPGGVLVFYFVENYPAHGFPANFRRYTKEGMRLSLRRHGFAVRQMVLFGNVWETVVTYQNVWLMEQVKELLFSRWVFLGFAALLVAAPFLIAGNAIALMLGRGKATEAFAIGHAVVARRGSAR